MRRAQAFAASSILGRAALGLAVLVAACGTNSVNVGGTTPAMTDQSLSNDLPLAMIASSCREFSAGFDDDFDRMGAALEDLARAISAEYPDEAALAVEVGLGLNASNDESLGRLGPLVPIVAGIDSCGEFQELLTALAPLEPPDPHGLAVELAAARQRWETHGPRTYYYETYFSAQGEDQGGVQCGMDGELKVQVVEGVATEAREGFNLCVVDLERDDRPPLTVEDWFAMIDELLEAPPEGVIELYASFDEIGLPNEFFVSSSSMTIEGGIQDLTEGMAPQEALTERVLTDLDAARQRWEAAGVESYRFQVKVVCFCAARSRGPFEIVVADGIVVKALFEGESVTVGPDRLFTIPLLFDEIARLAYSDDITVTYDPDLGYPLVIDADPVADAVDEEQRILVSGFVVDA